VNSAADFWHPRTDVFSGDELANSEHGYDKTLKGVRRQPAKLGVDDLDLYLIHWPMPKSNSYVDTFKAFAHLRDRAACASIGVSNFAPEHLNILIDATGIVPTVNQIELQSPPAATRNCGSYMPSRRGYRGVGVRGAKARCCRPHRRLARRCPRQNASAGVD